MTATLSVRMRTPCCNRAVAPCDFCYFAVLFIKRTCPRCRQRYQVIVRPQHAIETDEGRAFMHTAEWQPIENDDDTDKEN